MGAHARSVGLLMVLVLLVAVVAAQGPAVYIVTLDDQGNSYYLESTGSGTLGEQTFIGRLPTIGDVPPQWNYGAGIGNFTDDEYYDFVLGTGYTTDDPSILKEIYLYKLTNSGNDFQGPDSVGTWSSGDFSGDMAVAKFFGKVFEGNGLEGNSLDDFVMVRSGTQDAGLYQNNGNGGFVPSDPELVNAAPLYSFGADAADINHDGYADFVVAGAVGDPRIYVNLGKGDGTFETRDPIPTAYDSPLYGIAAADFDGDNKVDLIATSSDPYSPYANGFEFYKGDGSGGFTSQGTGRFGVGLISHKSPVDNFDLNGDGLQDLVVSNLPDPYSDAVMVGLNTGEVIDGNPEFGWSGPITGGEAGARYTIAAPPVFQNEPPVADFLITPALPAEENRIAKGTPLTFDGTISDDPEFEGMEPNYIEYSWVFEDEGVTTTTTSTTPVAEHTFDTSGTSYVTLTVTDNYGATSEKTVIIKVNHPTEANDDTYDTIEKIPLNVDAANGVLANDVDVDVDTDDKPDQLTAVLVSGPAHGTLTLNPDGSFTYDPDDDFPGPTDTPTDSFTYMVNDGWNDSNVATVTLEFNAPMTWKVNIVPNMINLKSNGVFIAFITLPKQYRAEDVVEGSVACQGASAVRLFRHSKLFPQTFGAIFRTQGLTDVKVKDKVTLTVTGTVISEGQTLEFSGSDTVRVFNLKSRARDETEEWDRQSEKNLFDKFPNNHGKGQDRDSSGHDGRNQGYDH